MSDNKIMDSSKYLEGDYSSDQFEAFFQKQEDSQYPPPVPEYTAVHSPRSPAYSTSLFRLPKNIPSNTGTSSVHPQPAIHPL